jgi:Chaperone for flagella basal body P-ring formation
MRISVSKKYPSAVTLWLMLFVCQPSPLHAQAAALAREASAFAAVENKTVRPLDQRLAKNLCAPPWHFAWTTTGQALQVTCAEKPSWQLFLAIDWATPSGQRRDRPVVRQAQAAGPLLVRRGDTVTIVTSGDGFQISRSAKALDAGRAGASIRFHTGDHAPAGRAIVQPNGTAMAAP